MFYKMRTLTPLPGFNLEVSFETGEKRRYDVKTLFDRFPVFKRLMENDLFEKATLSPGGYGVIWNDDIDLAGDEIYYGGEVMKEE